MLETQNQDSNLTDNSIVLDRENGKLKELQNKLVSQLNGLSETLTVIDSLTDECSAISKTMINTLVHEASGIMKLAANLQQDACNKAVEVLSKVKENDGKILFVSLGKTGHISRKIAATMASTGSDAFFVQATEANHGDLGNINPKTDAVIMISNSGESDESFSTAEFCAEKNVPLIVITSKPNSTLASYASTVLEIFSTEEACPLKLAPTTSTTVALALGDAIAMALMEKIGFTPDDFGASHPSGKLGMKRAAVRKNMEKPAPTISTEATIKEASKALRAGGLGCVVMTNEDGSLAGFLSDGDFSRAYENEIDINSNVAKVMTENPKTVDHNEATGTAYQHIKKSDIGCLIVVDDENKPVGILDRKKLQQKLG